MGNEVSEPLVTIGITCFNAADTIARAVGSALAQNWPNFEVVIVDDCSTDDSTDLIRAAIGGEPRAKLIRHSCNLGPAAARNTILSEGRGEFIAFFGVADYLLIYRRRADWFYGSGTPACSLLARHSTFAAVGGFDAQLRRVEDADFAIRLALMGGHFVGTRQTLFIQYSTSGLDKSAERNLEAHQRLVCKQRTYLESIDRLDYAKRWPRLRYWHFNRRYQRFFLELAALLVRHPFAVTRHLLTTGPRRFLHERRMRRRHHTCG